RRPTHGIADQRVTDGAQDERKRFLRLRQRTARLRARRADGGVGDQQVEHRADAERSDQSDRNVAVRVLGFLGGGGNRIEADVGEKDRRRRAKHAHAGQRRAPAIRQHWREIRLVYGREGEGNEDRQGDNLHHHQRGGEFGRLRRAEYQQYRDQQRKQERDQVEAALVRHAIDHVYHGPVAHLLDPERSSREEVGQRQP